MTVSSAIEKFDKFMDRVRKNLDVHFCNRERDDWTENELKIIESFWEVYSRYINTYSQKDFLNEMEDARRALVNLDPEGNIQWVSEDKMAELSGEYALELCFSNNAAIIMECNDYKNQHVWFVCLIKR